MTTTDSNGRRKISLVDFLVLLLGVAIGLLPTMLGAEARFQTKDEAKDMARQLRADEDADVARLEQQDRELRRELLDALHRIEDRMDRATRRGVVGADVLPGRGD